MNKGAIFSNDRSERLLLIRNWDETKPKIMFIGLNPSTANESKNDPTINRIIEICKHNGFGTLYMANLHTFITADPKLLQLRDQKVNNSLLEQYGKYSDKIVFAWGNFKQGRERAEEVKKMFPFAWCLHINKNGSPKHPLYCKKESNLITYQ